MRASVLDRGAASSPLLWARMAGLFWLLTALSGTLALLVEGTPGRAANLVATACYVTATLLVYALLKPVNGNLSLLAASFSMLGCGLGVLGAVLHVPVSSVPTLCFGLHCLLVGWLVLESTFLPRFVGALMVVAGLGWLTMGLTHFVSPVLARSLSPYLMAAGITGEMTLTLWLLAAGVNARRWQDQAGPAWGRG